MATTLQQATLKSLHDKLQGKNITLVQGACGTIGFNVVKCLHKKLQQANEANHVILAGIADLKDPNVQEIKNMGIDCYHLDLNNHDLVENVFTLNIKKLVIIPPYSPNRVEMCSRLIDIAHQSKKVKHYVFVSTLGAQTEAIPMFKDLKAIHGKLTSAVGPDEKVSVIGSASYHDNLRIMKNNIKQGTLLLPTGNAKWAPIWSYDVCEFIGKILFEGAPDQQIFTLTGPELLSGQEIAKCLSQELGRTINFVSVSPEDWKKQAVQNGLPEFKAESLKTLYQWYTTNNAARVFNDFETVVGTKPHTFADFIRTNIDEFK